MPVFRFFSLVFAVAAVLALPLAVLVATSGAVIDGVGAAMATVGPALAGAALYGLAPVRWRGIAASLLLAMVTLGWLVRSGYVFLYDFTGRGFGGEIFLHAGPTSLAIAIDEYGTGFGIVLAVLALACLGLVRGMRRVPPVPRRGAVAALVAGIVLSWLGATAAPEYLLARAAWGYYGISGNSDGDPAAVRETAARVLRPVRGSTPLPDDKSRLAATIEGRPYNLLLIYLESFNLTLGESSRYPGLTPRIDEMRQRFASLNNIRSSAYLTIEGIANSQCGTVIDMQRANNSMLSESGRMPNLPCLGDVLRRAGYRQSYLGGADLGFAGKGAFLRDHGYDEVLGWRYWDSVGLSMAGKWGLSDSDLFRQALDRLGDLRKARRPFNLTLLTLGMHPPGYAYADCPVYTPDPDKAFLNAIHCTDFLLGRFIDRLTESGALADTVLFIQADHGIFENPGMRDLFADDVDDRRLLTLVGLPPDHPRRQALQAAVSRHGASVDTVATLLDLLGIRSNANFVFSRSLLESRDEPNYVVTRRDDYRGDESFVNTPASCPGPSGVEAPTPPLDRCGKRRVLQALNALHRTFAPRTLDATSVCRLGAEVVVDREAGRFRVRWGDRDLSDQFHHRGTRIRGGRYRGVYAVHLEPDDGAPRAYFFGGDNEYDLWHLRKLLESAAVDERLMLLRDLDIEEMPDDLRDILPPSLGAGQLVYGVRRDNGLEPELSVAEMSAGVRFRPGSCPGGMSRQ